MHLSKRPTRGENRFAKIQGDRRPPGRGVSYISEIKKLQKIEKNIVKKFRLFRITERFVKYRVKIGPTLGIIQRQEVKVQTFCRTSNSEEVLSKQTWNLLAINAWDLHKNIYEVKGTYVQACEHFFRPPNRTTQEKVVASRSDFEHEDRELTVDSGASLHMTSKNELTSCEKIPSEDQKTPA